MSDWQDLTCQCKVRKRTPQTPGLAWTEQLQVSFCPLHSGTGEAPVAPVAEPPKPEKKPKRKKLTVSIAEKAFPVEIYRSEDMVITEYIHEVEVRRRYGEWWMLTNLTKNETSIIAAAWLAAHQEEK